ncbi:LOW QUALITY PROTEIN: cobalamin biosynthesis protein, partial [Rhodococcus opacus PD630]
MLGGTSLGRTGSTMAAHLEADDLAAARALLPSLCGRDPSVLGVDGLTRATLESVAENTSDSAVGAFVWGAVAGIPRTVRLPGVQHAGRDGRVPLAEVPQLRLGGGAVGRRPQPAARPPDGCADRRGCTDGRRVAERGVGGVATRRVPASQPQRGCRGGQRGGRTRDLAGRAHRVRARRRDATRPRLRGVAPARRPRPCGEAVRRGAGRRGAGVSGPCRSGRPASLPPPSEAL